MGGKVFLFFLENPPRAELGQGKRTVEGGVSLTGLNYVRCTIVQWQRIPQRETQPEPEPDPESETGIQQIRAGMLKYCKNTEIQRAAEKTKLRQQTTAVRTTSI